METPDFEPFENPTKDVEVFFWKHNPQSLLVCVRVLAWYLGDGKERVTLPQYSWKMAARILGLSGRRNNWTCPKWWKKRLLEYGIDPETFQISDQKRFGITWELLNEYCTEGQPWQISLSKFGERLREVNAGTREWRRASIVTIPWTSTRRTRKRPASWRERAKLATQEKARSNLLKTRIADFKRQFEEP